MTRRDVLLFFVGITWAAAASRSAVLTVFALGAWLSFYLFTLARSAEAR